MYNAGMPNQRDPEKRLINLWIPEVLYEKFAQKTKKDGVSMSSILLAYIIDQTKTEKLTPEAYERIAERKRRRRAGN